MDRCFAYQEELTRGGHFKGGELLQAPRNAATLRLRDGAVTVTDGPFAETKEQTRRHLFPGGARPQRGDPARVAPSRLARRAVRDPARRGLRRSRSRQRGSGGAKRESVRAAAGVLPVGADGRGPHRYRRTVDGKRIPAGDRFLVPRADAARLVHGRRAGARRTRPRAVRRPRRRRTARRPRSLGDECARPAGADHPARSVPTARLPQHARCVRQRLEGAGAHARGDRGWHGRGAHARRNGNSSIYRSCTRKTARCRRSASSDSRHCATRRKPCSASRSAIAIPSHASAAFRTGTKCSAAPLHPKKRRSWHPARTNFGSLDRTRLARAPRARNYSAPAACPAAGRACGTRYAMSSPG